MGGSAETYQFLSTSPVNLICTLRLTEKSHTWKWKISFNSGTLL